MSNWTWANPERIGIRSIAANGCVRYLDRGAEYEAAIAAGVGEYAGPIVDPAPTPEQQAARLAAWLAAWRAERVLPRAQFCTALLRAGLLTSQEAIAAAAGATPQPLEDAITLLPDADRDEARILWAGLTEVQRSHPLIELVAWSNDMTAEQVDALFGWQV